MLEEDDHALRPCSVKNIIKPQPEESSKYQKAPVSGGKHGMNGPCGIVSEQQDHQCAAVNTGDQHARALSRRSSDRMAAFPEMVACHSACRAMSTESELLALQQTIYRSRNPTRRWLHETRRRWITGKLARLAREGATVLEVGTGAGIYIPVLSTLFDEVVVVESEPQFFSNAERIAQALENVSIVNADISCARLAGRSFDIVLCSEVIEHVEESKNALKAMRKLLKPEGYLLLSLPQRFSVVEVVSKVAFLPWMLAIVKTVYREPVIRPDHINLKTENQILKELEDCGFYVQEKHKTGLYIPILAEFGGHAAVGVESWLETRIRGGIFDWTLWTQYYVATSKGA